MTDVNDKMLRLPRRMRMGLAAAALLAVGVVGGAGAVTLTRPSIEMAPTVLTAIGKLPASSGIVTIRGHVVDIFGDRFVIQDPSGRTMIDAGRHSIVSAAANQVVTVQGHYDNGQMRASYLIDASGRVTAVGPAAGRPLHGPGDASPPHRDGPRAGGPGLPGTPLPPSGCTTPPPAGQTGSPGPEDPTR